MNADPVTIEWDDKKQVFRIDLSTRKVLRVGDQVKFVAKGTPLVVFPNGSPFSNRKPDWIFGSNALRLKRATRKRLKFLCAVIKGSNLRRGKGGNFRRGKGGNLPPIKP
jgi:hypothetical protein